MKLAFVTFKGLALYLEKNNCLNASENGEFKVDYAK